MPQTHPPGISGDRQSWSGASIATDAPDELIGTTLNGAYVVSRVIGEGGMGRVYEARHTRIAQKRVAIKVLHPEFARNADVLARFQREGETAACVSHPNVVSVYDVDRTTAGMPYLVTEYLEGTELAEHLERVGKLKMQTAVHIAHQICLGLEAAHAKGVIHRDLKPQNVFLVGNFEHGVPEVPYTKILDFGLSRFLDASDSQLTKTGMIMGTPAFMAPEQAQGLRCDHRVDIYGVGAILYASLTGQPPFQEDTPQATIIQVLGREPTRPRALEPTISEYLELVIQRAMAKNPAERYPDMTALRLALEPILEAEAAPATSSGKVVSAKGSFLGRPGSRASLDAEAEEVRTARARLVLFLLLAIAVLSSSAAIAITGVEKASGFSLSRIELGLLLLAVLSGSVTPAALVLLRIRRDVWNNSTRVLTLLKNLRRALLTGIVVYGLITLLVHVVDNVMIRFAAEPERVFGVDWPGWNLFLPLVALAASGAALLRERLLSQMPRGWRRNATIAGISGAVALFALVMMLIGQSWREGKPSATEAAPAASAAVLAPLPNASTQAATHEPSAPTLAAAPTAPSRASDDELAAATAQGVSGLLPLAEKHPTDPPVLKALSFAFASRATGHADAMTVLQRLFEVAPGESRDPKVQVLVAKATETPGQASKLAFDLLSESMGDAGPDVLFELWLNKGKSAEQAKLLLEKPTTRSRFSPALAIAYDLRTAASCAARVPLLTRAAELGDSRSIAVLNAFATGSPRGCGKWKRSPCKPQCDAEAKQFRETADKISARLGPTRR